MNIDQKIEAYFTSTLESEIFDFFEFKEFWTYVPLLDQRNYYWAVSPDIVYYGEEIFVSDYDAMYTAEIMQKTVCRKGDYVLIVYDTHCDGNKFAGLFLANKELKLV